MSQLNKAGAAQSGPIWRHGVMPYIDDADRRHIDGGLERWEDAYFVDRDRDAPTLDIEHLADILKSVPSGKKKGAFNYFCSRLFLQTFILPDGVHYTETSNAIDVFGNMKTEWTRRILHPYEDKAIEENGDLPEMKQILEMLK